MNLKYSLLLLLLLVAFASAAPCNGLDDLCDLRIDQATFPGTHNAGSGFDGYLYYGGGGVALSCFYRNQDKSFTEQLAFGIRYFDIDTCYKNNEAVSCHCNSGICAYAGSISKAMHQVDTWMRNNVNEVVIIHFNRDIQEGKESNIANSIKSTLLSLWDPNSGGDLLMNTYHGTNRAWPTLGQAITNKQRIFIFMDNRLKSHVPQNWAYNSNYYIASSWGSNSFTSSCGAITTHASSKCTSTLDFMDLSAFGTAGWCVADMAAICSEWLGEAMEECYKKRITGDRTVNFLLVDWIQYFRGRESVVNKAKFMNEKNIQHYLNRNIFLPELAGCSYHPGWFYWYCWRYCSGYGWCWVNAYCGKDHGLCKRSELSCYGSCGY